MVFVNYNTHIVSELFHHEGTMFTKNFTMNKLICQLLTPCFLCEALVNSVVKK